MLKKIYSQLIAIGCVLSTIASRMETANKEAAKVREQLQILNKRVKEMADNPRPAVQPSDESASHDHEPDKWLQDGIAGIMSFQVGGKKRSDHE